jgi:hypothetical protein
LGNWVTEVTQIRIKYQAYRTKNKIYESFENHFKVWDIINNNKVSEIKETISTLPLNAIPCRFTIRKTIETSYLRQDDKPQTEKTQNTTAEVILVSDGSLIEGKGTWAAIMTDKRGVEIASCQGQVRQNNLNSYRVEL